MLHNVHNAWKAILHYPARNVRYCAAPSFTTIIPQPKKSAAQANGCRYENKVTVFVEHWAKGNHYTFKDHPWICYEEVSGKVKYCCPDYVLLSDYDDNLIIVEAKIRHTREVIDQLTHYRDLIGQIHPEYKVSLVEVCRYFDPDEYRMELLSELRPHTLPVAALLFEP